MSVNPSVKQAVFLRTFSGDDVKLIIAHIPVAGDCAMEATLVVGSSSIRWLF